MNRYINLIVLCLLILFVAYSSGEPSVKDPRHIGESFLSSLEARDFQQLAGCFHSEAQGRFLIPPGLVEAVGKLEIAGKFREWFGEADSFKIEESKVTALPDKLHISYRIRLHYEDTWYLVEQQIYAVVKEGLIDAIDLLCSGFLPISPQSNSES
jgi:hypothetical protein